jgi:hypothetical protein
LRPFRKPLHQLSSIVPYVAEGVIRPALIMRKDFNMTETIVVDLYCRVSTDPQEDNTSLDEQEASGRAYCLENGLSSGWFTAKYTPAICIESARS